MPKRRMIAITDVGPYSVFWDDRDWVIGLVGELTETQDWGDGWHKVYFSIDPLSAVLSGRPALKQFTRGNKLHIHQCKFTEAMIDDHNED